MAITLSNEQIIPRLVTGHGEKKGFAGLGRVFGNDPSNFIPPWPLWNDHYINETVWDLAVNELKMRSAKATASGGVAELKQVELEDVYLIDNTGRTMFPVEIKVDSWRRPAHLVKGASAYFKLEFESGDLDLELNNSHLFKYKVMRHIIGSASCLERATAMYPYFPTEFLSSTSYVPTTGPAWHPWQHVYANTKAGTGNQHTPQYNSYGMYFVRLFYLGAWRKVTVDDFIPLDAKGRWLLPRSKDVRNLWMPLLTKALFKVASISRIPDRPFNDFNVITTLTGYVCTSVDCRDVDPDVLWRILVSHVRAAPYKKTEVEGDETAQNEGKPDKTENKQEKTPKTKIDSKSEQKNIEKKNVKIDIKPEQKNIEKKNVKIEETPEKNPAQDVVISSDSLAEKTESSFIIHGVYDDVNLIYELMDIAGDEGLDLSDVSSITKKEREEFRRAKNTEIIKKRKSTLPFKIKEEVKIEEKVHIKAAKEEARKKNRRRRNRKYEISSSDSKEGDSKRAKARRRLIMASADSVSEFECPRFCVATDSLTCLNKNERILSADVGSTIVLLYLHDSQINEDIYLPYTYEAATYAFNVESRRVPYFLTPWKMLRWVHLAYDFNVIEDMPGSVIREIDLFIPLKRRIEKKNQTSREPLPILPERLNFDKIVKGIRRLDIYYRPSSFRQSSYTINLTGAPFANDWSATPINLEAVKVKPVPTSSEVINPPSLPNQCFYLCSDSLYCKTFFITLSVFNPLKVIPAGYLMCEHFVWSNPSQGVPLFSLRTIATKTFRLNLGPGLQTCRIYFKFPLPYYIQIHSDTCYNVGSKEHLHRFCAAETVCYETIGDEMAQRFILLVQAALQVTELQGYALERFYSCFLPWRLRRYNGPAPDITDGRIHFDNAVEDVIMRMVFELVPDDDLAITILRFRIVLLNPQEQ